MSTLPTGTITFLMTDIEGSTQLWEAQPDAMRADLERHDALVREAVKMRGGHVFKTVGDAFCAAFDGPEGAVGAALAAQMALNAEPWTVPGLRVRFALHTGEAQARDGDYFGPPLNRAARLRDAAHGGQILVSQAAASLLPGALPRGATLLDLGSHRLKDLARPEHVFQVVHPQMPTDFPRLRSLDALPNNLPQRLDSFIGRERELEQVKKRLTASRLLTLTGVGGAGKTRLAQQTAADGADDFPDGVWLVALESLSDPALVPQAVAQTLNLREQPGRSFTQTLCETLQSQTLLLLLDNCEHVIAACAHLAETLLQTCPRLRVLATSREPLGIRGEAVYPVPTLTGAGQGAGDEAAVRLFVDRAALSLPSFALTARNAPAVSRICRQLDGIPLALELAAPRVRTLTPEQISSRLEADFRLLTGGSRTVLPRQQTMRAAIQWSHDLLSEPERLLFRRLSAFAGGWTLEAAETVCAGDGLDDWEILDLLSSLAAKSLVQVDEEQDGTKRYRMLETLRQYSWEQLLASSGFDAVRRQHLAWFLALAERAEPNLRGPEQKIWLDCLEADHENFRAALVRSEGEARLRLASALQRFWRTRGYISEGRVILEESLRNSENIPAPVLVKAFSAAGTLAWAQADYITARGFYERALDLCREQGDLFETATALRNLGIVSDYQEEYVQARAFYEESLSIFRRLNDPWNIAAALMNLGAHLVSQNELDVAGPVLAESLALYQSFGDQLAVAMALYNLGRVAWKQGDWKEARAQLVHSLRLRREQGDTRGAAYCLFDLACTDQGAGQAERAEQLLAAADALLAGLGIALSVTDRAEYELLTTQLPRQLGELSYAELQHAGRLLTLPQAVALALSDTEISPVLAESSSQGDTP